MDYQFACVVQFLVFFCVLNFAHCIVGRDLVLTPKQGLQIDGKSIFYADDNAADLRNRSFSPWERTLKHVTFVTLFTSSAAEAAAGNLSKLREYNNFLQSPYIREDNANSGRFGDIVTLASGRVEEENNHTYRFIEGACNYQCAEDRVIALWQVQKIRHRDTHRTFRYEMKYSISPMRIQSYNGATAETNSERNTGDARNSGYQAYIQKDDDYPQSFGYLSYADDEQRFADRRLDAESAERSFRQVPPNPYNDYRQATPMPQPTFIRPNFLPPAPPPPPQFNYDERDIVDRLNIGEYIKHYGGPKATPKIEVFPNTASRMGFPLPPTTFHPNYNLNIPVPEHIFHPPPAPPSSQAKQQFPVKFPENSHEVLLMHDDNNKIKKPVVTHHFHHHFFMPQGGENSVSSTDEQQLRSPVAQYKQETATATPAYYRNYFQEEMPKQQLMPPAPQKVSFPLQPSGLAGEEQPQLQQQELVHVTPVPPLRKPQIYQMFPVSIGAKIPLFIYPGPIDDGDEAAHIARTKQKKPFVQSEPLDENLIRYSEPDPLYISGSPQLETPPNLQHFIDAVQQPNHHIEEAIEKSIQPPQQPDSIAAQLPPPAKGRDIQVPYIESENISRQDETTSRQEETTARQDETTFKQDQTHEHSIKDSIKISTEKVNSSTVGTTEATTTTVEPKVNDTLAAEVEVSTEQTKTAASNEISIRSRNKFISTSTTITPLRTVARGRINHATRKTTTTTEKPVLKWKPRRKVTKSAEVHKDADNDNSEFKEQPDLSSNAANSTLPISNQQQRNNEIFEILTQKSVSKSISFKVGGNGEEIKLIDEDGDDDNENNIKKV